jgi:exonuclease SbcC
MIPLKLSLRNFMCYRDHVPPINFESIHTACISGNNGNGKSALIDAITWALWGQTRANSDDELIHAGQSDVEVEFEFAVEKQRYRILRKHSKAKTARGSGQTILEFQLNTPEGFKVLSGESVSQTQQKITQTLHMDYETFINSAFLKQGRANEFTKKRPGERKEVLANILQLSLYDELEETAREIAKGHETTIALLETTLAGFQEDLALKPALQIEFEQAQDALLVAEKAVQEQDYRRSGLRRDKELLENKQIQLTELNRHLQDAGRNYNEWNEQASQCQARINGYELLIVQRTDIEQDYARFLDFRKQIQELDQKYKQVNSLIQSRHRLEMAVIKAGEDLNSQHAVAENRLRELQVIAEKVPLLQDQINQISGQLHALDVAEAKILTQRESSRNLEIKGQSLKEENTRLGRDLEEIAEKLKMLGHEEGVKCPLCESELGIDGQHRLAAKFQAEKFAKTGVLTNNRLEITRVEAEARVLDAEIAESDTKLKKARESLQNKYGQLSRGLADAREASEKIDSEKAIRDEIEQKLARRDFARNEQTALTQIEKEIAVIGYDSTQHESLRAQLIASEQFESPKRRLEEADRLIVQERAAREQACRMADELRLTLETANSRLQTLASELNAMSQVVSELEQAESEYQVLLAALKKIQEGLGGVRAKLEHLAGLEIRVKEKTSQLGEAAKHAKIYQDLAGAFGKKGVQATLIELAIPEIESEANKLLARMTDNRMHVKMETQRETKKGDVVETLDINISDELGTRNYEMFSGGEAFRIDFAMRIALSKLLARRAGAPLPTLIIDEGFGTQDSTGIEKIKEAITSIQDDFEKILVITHIVDFKDAFPLHIEVVKTSEGSTIYFN